MDRDDEQLLRHQTRELAKFLSVFYEELRAAGLPKRLASQITLGQWVQVQSNTQVEEMAQQLVRGILEDIASAPDEEEE